MSDVAEWLGATIEGDKAAAELAAQPGDGIWSIDHGQLDDEPRECPDEHCDHEGILGRGIRIYPEGGHDSSQAAHIVLHDPRDMIARCEAELAILDEHAPIEIEPGERRCSRCLVWHDDPANLRGRHPDLGRVDVAAPETYPCRTVRLLAHGYRCRPGWEEDWKP